MTKAHTFTVDIYLVFHLYFIAQITLRHLDYRRLWVFFYSWFIFITAISWCINIECVSSWKAKSKVFHSSGSRGLANHGWLISRHTFSFASYYNPDRTNFGALRVLNDDIVKPGQGFGTHPHQNMGYGPVPGYLFPWIHLLSHSGVT